MDLRTFCESKTSSDPSRRRTRSSSRSTPRRSTGRTAVGAARSRSSPVSSSVFADRSGRSSAWSWPGADEVVDYLQEDFTKNGETYDVVFDAVGKHSFSRCRRSLNPGGIYIATDGLHNLIWALWTSRIGNKRATLGVAKYAKKDVLFVKELIEAVKYRAVIDRSYPLEDVVEPAMYVDTGE